MFFKLYKSYQIAQRITHMNFQKKYLEELFLRKPATGKWMTKLEIIFDILKYLFQATIL